VWGATLGWHCTASTGPRMGRAFRRDEADGTGQRSERKGGNTTDFNNIAPFQDVISFLRNVKYTLTSLPGVVYGVLKVIIFIFSGTFKRSLFFILARSTTLCNY